MCTNLTSIPSKAVDAKPGDRQLVKCGHCEECLKEKQREWIYRIESEVNTNEHCLFGTLTYSPRYVPFIEYDTNEIFTYEYGLKYKPHTDCEMSINPKDCTDYWKRVRDQLGYPKLKHYTCMEYGDEFDRPHMHYAVFYNDVPPWMAEAALRDSWYQGFVDFEPLCDSRIKYVTKYLKKGDAEAAPSDLSLSPRSHKSHGFGVDRFFKDEAAFNEYYKRSLRYGMRTGNYTNVPEDDKLRCVQCQDGTKLALPRYFRRKFYEHEDFTTQKIIEDEERRYKKLNDQVIAKMQDLRCKGLHVSFEEAQIALLSDRDGERIKNDVSTARLRKKGL